MNFKARHSGETELEHIRDTLTHVVNITGETRRDVKILDCKVDRLEEHMVRVEEDVTILKEDTSALKEDMISVKADVNDLKDDVSVLKEDMTLVKGDISELKQGMSGVKNHLSNHDKRFDQLEMLIRQLLPNANN